ncbi:MAG: FAD-dependent oxidoreductase [Bacillota bacterium]|nr:FAD-dependent oxidoreductase [Bacillota bacterium]MDW7683533.1 FAD-dependent oxidoreductase [Bacillota bacterium]
MKYVIIGNSAAAVGAVEGIRQRDKVNPITIISDEPHHTYSRPLISYLLSGKVTVGKMGYRPADFYRQNHVNVLFGEKAVGIDTKQQNVFLADNGSEAYDRLLIATGSRPGRLAIPGIDKKNVYTLYTMDDALRLKQTARAGMKGVVLGAGLTAIKAAEALVMLGVDTTLVVRSRILRNFLDDSAGSLLGRHLVQSGLRLAVGSEPAEIAGNEAAENVVLTDGRFLPCDFVVSAVGIEANTAVVAGSPVHVDQGILTDERMQTNVPRLYAAGDVAQGCDLLSGTQRIIPLLPVAYAQGETAGRNMAGDDAVYAGMGMNAVSFFGLPIISAGLIHGKDDDEICLHTKEHQNQYRKLTFRNGRLIGFILVDRIDRAGILTWLIREKINITPFRQSLLDGTFNHAHLPAALRREKLSAAT